MNNTANTFLLNDLIDQLTNTEQGLSASLMKLKLLARLTGNKVLAEYATNELNGYSHNEHVPEYRHLSGILRVVAMAGFHTHTLEVPISALEKPYDDVLEVVRFSKGISAIEKMASDALGITQNRKLMQPVPIQMMHVIEDATRRVYRTDAIVQVQKAFIEFNAGSVIDLPNNIRSKLLDFTMDLVDEFGFEINLKDYNSNQLENNKSVRTIMTTNITNSGDGSVINTGAKSNLNTSVSIVKGDKKNLAEYLHYHKVSEEDTNDLLTIIDNEKVPTTGGYSEGVNAWTKKLLGKSIDGTWDVGIGAAGGLVAEGLKAYFGF